MCETKEHPGEPSPNRSRFQYSLRTLFVVTMVAAMFFLVAVSFGYSEAVFVLAVVEIIVGVRRLPRRFHLVVGILLTQISVNVLAYRTRDLEVLCVLVNSAVFAMIARWAAIRLIWRIGTLARHSVFVSFGFQAAEPT